MKKLCGLWLAVLLVAPVFAAEEAEKKSGQSAQTGEGGGKADEKTVAGWRAIRALDCARCHGAKFEGQVGPSLLKSAKERDAESFKRLVLEGNPGAGMPAYKENKTVADNIDGIHAYFKGRADGSVPEGKLGGGDSK